MHTSTLAHRRGLWLAALAGPLAWSIYFLTSYSLLEAACRSQIPARVLPLLSGTAPQAARPAVTIVLVLTAATLLICVYGGWLAYRHWRRLSGLDAETERFMAVAGILLNGLFAFLALAHGLPTLVLSPCW